MTDEVGHPPNVLWSKLQMVWIIGFQKYLFKLLKKYNRQMTEKVGHPPNVLWSKIQMVLIMIIGFQKYLFKL